MTRFPVLLAAAVAALLSACLPTTVGIPCDSRSDCAPGQECLVAPQGFCTRGCTEPGETRDCPVGSVCSLFGGTDQVCSTICETNDDCRANYKCEPTGGNTSTRKACRPIK
jgi:hypothetical protein